MQLLNPVLLFSSANELMGRVVSTHIGSISSTSTHFIICRTQVSLLSSENALPLFLTNFLFFSKFDGDFLGLYKYSIFSEILSSAYDTTSSQFFSHLFCRLLDFF